MAFDRDLAERTVVEILDGQKGGRVVGMGFRLLDDVIATACRCLPHVEGRVRLPDPDEPGTDHVFIRVRQPSSHKTALAVVIAADPCSDFALLSAAPTIGTDLPGGLDPLVPFLELIAGVAPALVEPSPAREGPAFIYTHERRWVAGVTRSFSISVTHPANRIRTCTSGAPVFNQDGRVVGLVGYNDIRLPDATMCVLAEQLPGWALRKAREAEAARATGKARANTWQATP